MTSNTLPLARSEHICCRAHEFISCWQCNYRAGCIWASFRGQFFWCMQRNVRVKSIFPSPWFNFHSHLNSQLHLHSNFTEITRAKTLPNKISPLSAVLVYRKPRILILTSLNVQNQRNNGMKLYSVDHTYIFSCLYVVYRAKPFLPHYRGSTTTFEENHIILYPISKLKICAVHAYLPLAMSSNSWLR